MYPELCNVAFEHTIDVHPVVIALLDQLVKPVRSNRCKFALNADPDEALRGFEAGYVFRRRVLHPHVSVGIQQKAGVVLSHGG